jgi:hypothetical protein
VFNKLYTAKISTELFMSLICKGAPVMTDAELESYIQFDRSTPFGQHPTTIPAGIRSIAELYKQCLSFVKAQIQYGGEFFFSAENPTLLRPDSVVVVFEKVTPSLYGTRSANFNRLICPLWHAFETDAHGFKTESSHGPMCMCKCPIHFAQAKTDNAARAAHGFYHNSNCTAANLTDLLSTDKHIAEKLALVLVWSILSHMNRGTKLDLDTFLHTIDVLMYQHKTGMSMSLMDTVSGVVAEVAVPGSDEEAVSGSDEEAVSGSGEEAVPVSDAVAVPGSYAAPDSWADQMLAIEDAVRSSVAAAANLASGAETETAPDALVPA